MNHAVKTVNFTSATNDTVDNFVNVLANLQDNPTAVKTISAQASPAKILEEIATQWIGANCNAPQQVLARSGTVSVSGQRVAPLSLNGTTHLGTFRNSSFAGSPQFASYLKGMLSDTCTRMVVNIMLSDTLFQAKVGTLVGAEADTIVTTVVTATFADLTLPSPLPNASTVSLSLKLNHPAASVASVKFLSCVAWDFESQKWLGDGCELVSRSNEGGEGRHA